MKIQSPERESKFIPASSRLVIVGQHVIGRSTLLQEKVPQIIEVAKKVRIAVTHHAGQQFYLELATATWCSGFCRYWPPMCDDNRTDLSLSALPITETDERLIAAAANIGEISSPKNG